MNRRIALLLSSSSFLFANICLAELPGSPSPSGEIVAIDPAISPASPTGDEIVPIATASNEIVIDGDLYSDIPEVDTDTDDEEDGLGNQCVLTEKESLNPADLNSAVVEMFFCSVTVGGCKDKETKKKEKQVDCVGLNVEQCKAKARKQCEDALALDEDIFCVIKGDACKIFVKEGDDKETKEIEGQCVLRSTETKATGALDKVITIDSETKKIIKGGATGTCYYICAYNCQKKEKAL